MEQTAVVSAAITGSITNDLSIWGLFLQADIIVKSVMVILVLASFWCWAIIFEKIIRLRRLWGQAEEFEEVLKNGSIQTVKLSVYEGYICRGSKDYKMLDDKFNARYSAKDRMYKYYINECFSPFSLDTAWYVKEKINKRFLDE